MEKISTISIIALLSFPAFATSDETLLSLRTWYGDNMGSTSETAATRKVENLYDKNNRLIRSIQNNLNEDGSTWATTYYNLYSYDEQGNLLETSSLAYKQKDAISTNNDTIRYEYNELGQLYKMTNCARKTYYLHTYNSDGNLIEQSRWKYNTTQKEYINDQTLSYSDFTTGGPQSITATATSSYNRYTGAITYDAQGNKLSEKHWTVDATPVLNFAEYWTYNDNGFLVCYESKGIKNGEEVNSSKTEYEKIDNNNIRSISYTYNDGWKKKGGTTNVATYSLYNGETYSTEITQTKVNSKASEIEIQFTANQTLSNLGKKVSYLVYRDGKKVATIASEGQQSFTHVDTQVENGQHEYFIQTVVDDKHYNISNLKTVSMEREYPHATELKAIAARLTTDQLYYVTLSWHNPEITADMGYLSTNIMKVGEYSNSAMLIDEEVITDPAQESVEVCFSIDPVQQVYVQLNFEGSSTQSAVITVDASKLADKISETNKKLRVTETWGDAMGTDNGCTKKEISYYGPDNRIQRVGRYSKNSQNNTWTIYEYDTYYYGASGMLEKKWTRKYGAYDFGDLGYAATKDTTFYEYNVEGQLVVETDMYGTRTEHTYDGSGNLIVTNIFDKDAESPKQTITYSDFAGKNKPCLTISSGTLSSYRWKLETEYDNNTNKVSEKKSTYKSSSDSYSPSQYEIWAYDELGELVGDTIFTLSIKNGEETRTYKSYTSYEAEANNANRVKVVKRVWDSILKKWGNSKTWNVYEYAEINGSKFSPIVQATNMEGSANSIKLTFSAADFSAMTAYNVYRDGIEIAHAITGYDENFETGADGISGWWYYSDMLVRNGSHDYFVEYCTLDNTLSEVASASNISEVIVKDFNTPLPAPSNLHETSRRFTTTNNSETGEEERNVFISLGWNAVNNVEQYGFLRYNVMITGSQIADNKDKDGTALNYELAMRGLDSISVYVQAVYSLGRANSDTLCLKDENTHLHQLVGASTNAMLIFNQRGQLVGTKHKDESFPEELPSGIYILVSNKKSQVISISK